MNLIGRTTISLLIFFGCIAHSEGRELEHIPVGAIVTLLDPITVIANSRSTELYKSPNKGDCKMIPSEEANYDRLIPAARYLIVDVKVDAHFGSASTRTVTMSLQDQNGKAFPAVISCWYIHSWNSSLTENDLNGIFAFEFPPPRGL